MKGKSVLRYKRIVVSNPNISANAKRSKIDPKTKYVRKIKQKVDVINEMLDSLEESGYNNTWASKILFNKLDTNKINAIVDTRVSKKSISKSKSMSNLAYIDKALTDFMNSKTSTVSGIKSRIRDERKLIAEQTDNKDFADSLTDDEINQIYEVFNDVNYKQLTESGQYDSDEMFTFITTAKEQEQGSNQFIKMISTYSEDNPDADTKRAFRNIYNKYVKYQK